MPGPRAGASPTAAQREPLRTEAGQLGSNYMDRVYDLIEKLTRKAEVGALPAWLPVEEVMQAFTADEAEVDPALEGWESLGIIEFAECVRFSRHAVRPVDRPLRCYVCGLPRLGPPRGLASGRSSSEGEG